MNFNFSERTSVINPRQSGRGSFTQCLIIPSAGAFTKVERFMGRTGLAKLTGFSLSCRVAGVPHLIEKHGTG